MLQEPSLGPWGAGPWATTSVPSIYAMTSAEPNQDVQLPGLGHLACQIVFTGISATECGSTNLASF